MVTVPAMQAHAERLCEEHDIVWRRHDSRSRRAYALPEFEEIHTPPIRGAVSYAVVMHEIGHVLGRYQRSRSVLVREDWAWRWARRNALLWTPQMERCATRSLGWYVSLAAPEIHPITGGAGQTVNSDGCDYSPIQILVRAPHTAERS